MQILYLLSCFPQMSKLGVNIATFHLGRRDVGGEAVALIEIDDALPAGVLDEIKSLPQVVRADSLQFPAQD